MHDRASIPDKSKQLYSMIIENIYGVYKALRNVKFFPKGTLEGKNVAVIGPAATALQVERKDYIHGFDYVIRINRAIISWKKEQDVFIGKRTDILIHNFFENDDTGGAGLLNIDLFEQYGVKYLFQPRFDFLGVKTIVNFYKKHKVNYPVYTLAPSEYKQLKNKFGEFLPTRGYYALYTALTSNCNAVFVTGFTFFLTPYQGGYRSSQTSVESIKALIKSQGYHSPDLELELFADLITSSRVKKIILDDFLYDLILQRNPALSSKVTRVGKK